MDNSILMFNGGAKSPNSNSFLKKIEITNYVTANEEQFYWIKE